jgi:hypothetical protein
MAVLERRVVELEARPEAAPITSISAPESLPESNDELHEPSVGGMPGPRRYASLLFGLAALLLAHWTVVLWLDLPLVVLRVLSLFIPFAVGFAYLRRRPRLSWTDAAVAIGFALASVGAMNASVAWADQVPVAPQGAAAWRETLVYALSIGASLYTGMLVRVVEASLSARGLASLPKLRDTLLSANKKMPMDTLKAIETTVLLAGTALTGLTSVLAGLIGASR